MSQTVSPLRTNAVLLLVVACASGQNYPDPRIPRTKDGKPNLTAPAPRLNGKPDLSGLWQAERTPEREYTSVLGNEFAGLQIDLHDINKNTLNVFWGLKPEEEPLRPEGPRSTNGTRKTRFSIRIRNVFQTASLRTCS